MNVLPVTSWAPVLAQLAVQVALWLAFGGAFVGLTTRRGPRARAEAVTWVLAGVLLLTALALFPWPAWYRLPVLVHDTGPIPLPQSPELAATGSVMPSWAVAETVVGEPPKLDLSDLAWSAPPALASFPEPEPAPAASHFGWWVNALALGIVALAGLGCLRFVAALWAVRECRRRSRPIDDLGLHRLAEELRRAMGVSRRVDLRELPGLGTPATLGWRSPLILLPSDWKEWDAGDLTGVLAHELAHVRRGDYRGWLLARLSAALHPYQPLVHWLIGLLHRDQELAADALASRFAGGPARYTQTLCRLALRRDDGTKLGLARAFLPARLSLTRRVHMLLARKDRSETPASPRWRAGLGIALAFACLTVAGLRSPADAERPAKTEDRQERAFDTRTEREAEIERRLQLPISLDYQETPLRQVLDDLRELTGLNILVDQPALSEEGISQDQPITVKLKRVTTKAALKLILQSVSLTYLIRDEMIGVTTPKHARGKLVSRTYPVADLVVPVQNWTVDAEPNEKAAPGKEKEPVKTLEDRLIHLIVTTIAPETWSVVGGVGTAEYFPLGMALIVNQTADVQEQVAELLEALRRLNDLTVSVDVIMVTTSEATARKAARFFGIESAPAEPNLANGPRKVAFLDDARQRELLDALRTDPRTCFRTGPRMTLLNGQEGGYGLGNETSIPGFRLGLQPVASVDQRSVRLKVQARLAGLESEAAPSAAVPAPNTGAEPRPLRKENPLPMDTTIVVPNGSTAVLTGWKVAIKPSGEAGKSPGSDVVFLLLTPRIVSQAEQVCLPPKHAGVVPEPVDDPVGRLLTRYRDACRAGRLEDARKLAAEALRLDPACFERRR